MIESEPHVWTAGVEPAPTTWIDRLAALPTRRRLTRLERRLNQALFVLAAVSSIGLGWVLLSLDAPALGWPGVAAGALALVPMGLTWTDWGRGRRWLGITSEVGGQIALAYLTSSPFLLLLGLMSAVW